MCLTPVAARRMAVLSEMVDVRMDQQIGAGVCRGLSANPGE